MLKRSCPFGDAVSNQMKTHVGQKEVAEGVDREKHMKEVYDRTLAMMFEAQKQASKSDSTVATNGHHLDNGSMSEGAEGGQDDGSGCPHMELLPGQCFLDEHGKIIVGQTAVSKSNEADRAVPPRCCSCHKPVAPIALSRCSACQEPSCPACLTDCLQCENGFCTMCSLTNYDEDFERIFCLSCSSVME